MTTTKQQPKPFWHTTGNGLVYGPFAGDLTAYQAALRKAYGGLQGVKICNASSQSVAAAKLLHQYDTWNGSSWDKPLPLID